MILKARYLMHLHRLIHSPKWKEERGDSMIAVVIVLLTFAVFISFFFFDLFTIFANKRMNQTAADAASIAAAKKAAEAATDALGGDIRNKMAQLDAIIGNEAKARANEYFARCKQDINCSCTWYDCYDKAWNEIVIGYSVPYSIAANLASNPHPQPMSIVIVDAVGYFYPFGSSSSPVSEPPEKVRQLFDQAIQTSLDTSIRSEAEKYAKMNKDGVVTEIQYDPIEYAISVVTKRKLSFQTAENKEFETEPAVANIAKAGIQKIKGIEAYYDLQP